MVLTVTKAVVIQCKHGRVSRVDELRAYCNATGVTSDQRLEYTVLVQKLTLGKGAPHYLGIQHNLDIDPKCDADSTKYMIVDHITSGGCQASTEFCLKRLPPSSRVLPLASLMYLLTKREAFDQPLVEI